MGEFHIEDASYQEFKELYPNGMLLEDLLSYYDLVNDKIPLNLEWKCPGRIKKPAPTEKNDQKVTEDSTKISGPKINDTNTDFALFEFNEPIKDKLDMDLDETEALDPSMLGKSLIGSKTHRPREQLHPTMDNICKQLARKQKEERLQFHKKFRQDNHPSINSPDGLSIGSNTQENTPQHSSELDPSPASTLEQETILPDVTNSNLCSPPTQTQENLNSSPNITDSNFC